MAINIDQKSPHRFFYGYLVVLIAFFILVVIWGPSMSYGVYFESLLTEFGWTRAAISGASSLVNLSFGLFCIITARLCDRFNPRLVISVCGLLLGSGFFLMSRINQLWQLYLSYGVAVALGMSAYIAILTIVTRWFIKLRGLMTGIVLSGMGIGIAVMPPITNWLMVTCGWRTSLLILGGLSLVIMVSGAQLLKHHPSQVGQLPYGMNMRNNGKESSIELQGISVLQALRTKQFWLICGMYFIFLWCLLIVLVHIIIHAIGLGMSPASAANMLAVVGGLSIIGMNLVGAFGDKFGSKTGFIVSFALTALSFFWLLVATNTTTIFVFAVIFGFAYGGIQVLFSPLVAELFGLKSHGVILASCALAGTVGAALGPFFAGYVFDYTSNYSLVFLVSAMLALLALLLTILLRPTITK